MRDYLSEQVGFDVKTATLDTLYNQVFQLYSSPVYEEYLFYHFKAEDSHFKEPSE